MIDRQVRSNAPVTRSGKGVARKSSGIMVNTEEKSFKKPMQQWCVYAREEIE